MTNRRSFIRNGSLLALAGFVRPASLFASASTGSIAANASSAANGFSGGEILLAPIDREILNFIARYGAGHRLIGAAVLARLRGNTPASTRILVEVSDPGTLFSVFSTGPFANAHAQGNVVSFRHKEAGYSIENLMGDEFAGRLAALDASQNVAFAHDALTYDPVTKRLSDPLGAVGSREIKLLNPGLTGAAAMNTALRGIAEAGEIGLRHGAEFERWSAGVLASGSRRGQIGESNFRQTQTT